MNTHINILIHVYIYTQAHLVIYTYFNTYINILIYVYIYTNTPRRGGAYWGPWPWTRRRRASGRRAPICCGSRLSLWDRAVYGWDVSIVSVSIWLISCVWMRHVTYECGESRSSLWDRAATCMDQHTATHCSTPQHTATHCNTLQYTATHLQPWDGELHGEVVEEGICQTQVAFCVFKVDRVHLEWEYITHVNTSSSRLECHTIRWSKRAFARPKLPCAFSKSIGCT
jgi:hypothetical protein